VPATLATIGPLVTGVVVAVGAALLPREVRNTAAMIASTISAMPPAIQRPRLEVVRC
jgi:hypothetical protein